MTGIPQNVFQNSEGDIHREIGEDFTDDDIEMLLDRKRKTHPGRNSASSLSNANGKIKRVPFRLRSRVQGLFRTCRLYGLPNGGEHRKSRKIERTSRNTKNACPELNIE